MNSRLWHFRGIALVAGLLAIGAPIAAADEVADFYSGKTIQVIIGYSVGGGYDLYARTLAHYMGKHIPGNPTLVPQNMPGAGSLRAANYLAKAAPKDGTFIGTFARGMAMEPLLGHTEGIMFDATQLNWLGSINEEVSLCITSKASGFKTLDDLKAKPSTFGGNGPGSDPDVFVNVLVNLFKMPIKLVSGYPGSNDAILSVERGEVNGFCGASWSELKSRHKSLLGDINMPIQMALHKHDELPNVPLIMDLTSDPQEKAALKMIFARQTMARPFVAPPGVPPERVAALRKAFDETVRDPEFLDEAKRLEMEVRPVSGEQVEELIKEIYATPPDILKIASQAVAPKEAVSGK
jgi:tripartite-type tricarboxylate transporter receptor subunit TctC